MTPFDPETVPSRPVLRRMLGLVLRTDSDFNAFCLDFFPDIYERFTTGMDRVQKSNLLLTLAEPTDIFASLLESHQDDPGATATIQHLLAAPTTADARQAQQQWVELDALYLEREMLLRDGQSPAAVDSRLVAIKRAQRLSSRIQEGEILAERYRLIEVIGRGGFAKVWRAFDVKMKRSVAVKILHSEQGDELRRIARFERGARQMQKLDHPSIVHVLDGPSEHHGFHYFVMEHLAGGDLYHAVLNRKIEEKAALQAILQVGAALEHAHQRGLIHRDVKPQNILLDGQGGARLTDFDLVWAPDTTGGTHTGAMGTFIYAAPEEMEDASRVDHRADIYSLGMTILFVLSGRSLSRKALDARLLFIDELYCSESFKKLLRHTTAPDPDDRPTTVAQLCYELACAAEVDAIKQEQDFSTLILPCRNVPYPSQTIIASRKRMRWIRLEWLWNVWPRWLSIFLAMSITVLTTQKLRKKHYSEQQTADLTSTPSSTLSNFGNDSKVRDMTTSLVVSETNTGPVIQADQTPIRSTSIQAKPESIRRKAHQFNRSVDAVAAPSVPLKPRKTEFAKVEPLD